jgi:glycosyltransferase involved in cell wall biosynthesis
MERSIYRSADSIVALSPAIKAAIQKKVPEKSIHLIPNMADCEFFRPQDKRQDLEEKFQVSGKFVVSYIGALGIANGLDFYLECARAAQKANLPLHFLLCGEGAMRESLLELTGQLNLQNLSFVDFVNRDGVNEVMNVTDAVFICYKPIPILETGSPNKFFDGLAAGKLIITNFGGWIRQEIEENRCGVFVDPQKPDDFVNKLTPFLSNRLQLLEFQVASRGLAERKYSRELLSKEFVGLFRE